MIRPFFRSGRAIPVVLALALAGCAGLFTKTPLPLYRLTVPTAFPAGLPRVPVQLIVAPLDAPLALDTSRVAINRPSLAFDYLADGEWTDRAPALVRTALIEALENSKAVAGVGRDTFALRADFIIDGELRHFEAVYDSQAAAAKGAPSVEVQLALRLVKIPGNTIVAQTVISAREPAAANATPQIVEAFNAALGRAVQQAVTWTVGTPALSARRR